MITHLNLGYQLDVHCDAPSAGLSVEQIKSLIGDYYNFKTGRVHVSRHTPDILSTGAIAAKYGISQPSVRRLVRAHCTLTVKQTCPACKSLWTVSVRSRGELTDWASCNDCQNWNRGHLPGYSPAFQTATRVEAEPQAVGSDTLALTDADKKFLASVGIKA